MREVLTGLAERRLGEVVEARFAEEPVVVLNGPRTVGKSTLLSELAGRLGRAVIDCDDLATRAAVRSDPARFVESDQPVLIDEYQHVPELLDAIKAQLNRDLRPGRYVLAGLDSVRDPARSRASPYRARGHHSGAAAFPGRNRRRTRDIRRQAARRRWHRHDPITDVDAPRRIRPAGDLRRHAGGPSPTAWPFPLPMVLQLRQPGHRQGCPRHLRVRQREMLPRLLGQLAARSGQVLNMAAISGTIGLEKSTTENYTKPWKPSSSSTGSTVGHDPGLTYYQAPEGAPG